MSRAAVSVGDTGYMAGARVSAGDTGRGWGSGVCG